MITVIAAPPFLCVQDAGRTGYRASGVPTSGAMDLRTFRTLNHLLGNSPNAAMLEWALAGGTLRFEQDITIVIGGAVVDATLGEVPIAPNRPIRVGAGSELSVTKFLHGRFLYVAVAGGIEVPAVLGSRSTNLVAGFGGLAGRSIRTGDILPVGTPPVADLTVPSGATPLHVLRGPQASLFDGAAWDTFLRSAYTVTSASDRMGYRLTGSPVMTETRASAPSEPVCAGTVQVPPDGQPIVVMRDGPTVGGYPKIAVVRSDDVSLLAQCPPQTKIAFVLSKGWEDGPGVNKTVVEW